MTDRRCANRLCGNLADPRLYGRCEPCAEHYIRYGNDRPLPLDDLNLPSSIQVARMTGLTYRQVDYICRTKVHPTIQAAGSGSQRGWTLDDVVAAIVANIAMHHRLNVDPRNPPPFVTLRPGVMVRFDLPTIRADVLERWPDGCAHDLPGRVDRRAVAS